MKLSLKNTRIEIKDVEMVFAEIAGQDVRNSTDIVACVDGSQIIFDFPSALKFGEALIGATRAIIDRDLELGRACANKPKQDVCINVKGFGVVGDNKTDYSEILLCVCDKFDSDTERLYMYFPAGIYPVSDYCAKRLLSPSITLEGHEHGSFLLNTQTGRVTHIPPPKK